MIYILELHIYVTQKLPFMMNESNKDQFSNLKQSFTGRVMYAKKFHSKSAKLHCDIESKNCYKQQSSPK